LKVDTAVRVVVPCRNAADTIERCVAALMASRGPSLEIVLVDDGGNGDLARLAALGPLRVVHTSSDGRGAAAARNLGVRGASDVIVFIDADVEVEPEAIARLIQPIVSGLAGATVGRYSPDVTGLGFAQAYKQRYLARAYGVAERNLRDTYWTALAAVRASAFDRAGGFDATCRGAGPEDVLLGIALTRLGATIAAVPEAAGRHLAPLSVIGLSINDFRKGTEDIYVHWTKAVPLTHNRHARVGDIAPVAVAGTCVGVAVAALLSHAGAEVLSLGLAAHLALRVPLLRGAFAPNAWFLARAIPLTFWLDLVRAAAVVAGSALAALETLSRRRVRPFRQAIDERREVIS
jgi:GT2 family glycosyltransferase